LGGLSGRIVVGFGDVNPSLRHPLQDFAIFGASRPHAPIAHNRVPIASIFESNPFVVSLSQIPQSALVHSMRLSLAGSSQVSSQGHRAITA
jgi:hypothetical protein